MAQRVHPQRPAFHHPGFFGGRRLTAVDRLLPPQKGADAFDEKALAEGLLDIVVSPHPQAQNLIDLIVLGGEENHRNRRLLPHPLQQVHPVHPRHLDVKDRHVGHPAIERLKRGLTVVVGLDLEAFSLKRHGDRRQNVPVVVHQGDA